MHLPWQNAVSRGRSNTGTPACLTFPTASPRFRSPLTSQAEPLHADVFQPWHKYSRRFLLKSVQQAEAEATEDRRLASRSTSSCPCFYKVISARPRFRSGAGNLVAPPPLPQEFAFCWSCWSLPSRLPAATGKVWKRGG